jgi:hypothetical protein
MKTLYRAYCRSTASAQCAPYVMLAAVIIMAVVITVVRGAVTQHFAGLVIAARDAAAVTLCGLAAVTGIRICRAVAAARGSHYSYIVRTFPAPEPGRVLIGEHADGTPVSVPVPVSYTLRQPEPEHERVPGKSDVLTPLAGDLAEMAAEADALRDGDLEPVVSTRGGLFVLGETGGDES